MFWLISLLFASADANNVPAPFGAAGAVYGHDRSAIQQCTDFRVAQMRSLKVLDIRLDEYKRLKSEMDLAVAIDDRMQQEGDAQTTVQIGSARNPQRAVRRVKRALHRHALAMQFAVATHAVHRDLLHELMEGIESDALPRHRCSAARSSYLDALFQAGGTVRRSYRRMSRVFERYNAELRVRS